LTKAGRFSEVNNGLLVPIHLDALVLENEETVLEAMADFSRLPYYDGLTHQNINADVAYISENIVSHPFRDKSLVLKRGVHLHWALPDALTQGLNNKGGLVFPVVPDRWLVTRCKLDGSEQKQWIVESDYLHPEGKQPDDTVSFPLPLRPQADKGRAAQIWDCLHSINAKLTRDIVRLRIRQDEKHEKEYAIAWDNLGQELRTDKPQKLAELVKTDFPDLNDQHISDILRKFGTFIAISPDPATELASYSDVERQLWQSQPYRYLGRNWVVGKKTDKQGDPITKPVLNI